MYNVQGISTLPKEQVLQALQCHQLQQQAMREFNRNEGKAQQCHAVVFEGLRR